MRLKRVALPGRTRAVLAAIGAAQRCLTGRHLLVRGGAALAAQGARGPAGELVVGKGDGGALVGFYVDAPHAARAQPEAVRNAGPLHARVERHGAVIVLWLAPSDVREPAAMAAWADLRRGLRACGLS